MPSHKLFSSSKTAYPRLDAQTQLYKFYYGSKTDLFGVSHTFGLDTLSNDELHKAFTETAQVSNALRYDSICGFFKGIMVKSPLKSSGIKGAENLRGVWSYSGPLVLEKVLNADGSENTSVFKQLQKKYAAGEKQRIAKWTSNVMILKEPVSYMGFLVPSDVLFQSREKGVIKWHAETSGMPDYYTSCANHYYDGNWHKSLKDGMFRFSSEMNVEFGRIFKDQEVDFPVLLTFDDKGNYQVEALGKPLSKNAEVAFKNLQKYVGHLRPALFRPLFTADGKIMRARFWKVHCGPNGWLIEDYLAL